MLDEILDLAGNRSVFNTLSRFIADKSAIAFVGAGASAGMYPLWEELIEALADFATSRGKAQPQDRERWKLDRESSPQQRVKVITRKLGEDLYRQFLRDTFAPRTYQDRRFTRIHEALLRLPFRGYVTTNYDPALDFARGQMRPNCLTTGTPTWQDDFELHRWFTGDVFLGSDACPILWLHGYWQKPNSIVLNAGEYADVYKPGLYKRTFERLLGQDHLVFAGFGFNDPQFTFMVGEIMRDVTGAGAIPRHVALLGLPPERNGAWPQTESIVERRLMFEEDYHVQPLFYRIRTTADGRQDHSELLMILEALGGFTTAHATLTETVPADLTSEAEFHARWVHETSNDSKFTGRAEERARLDRWVRDSSVRAIGISAIGGTGKTALTGYWLKQTDGWRTRPFAGMFGWSFYQERDTTLFLASFLNWAHETFGAAPVDMSTSLVRQTSAVLRDKSLIVVLDGLEVLQEGPFDARHGSFLDGTLRELLGVICAREHESLAVLTSRFVFADLEQYLGSAFHQLELRGLTPDHGAILLEDLGVYGSLAERTDVSRMLEGHPLALRLFGEAIPEARVHEPREFLREAFRVGNLDTHSPLAAKVERLLEFYERQLTSTQVRLLSIVALFRSPAADETVLRIARGLFARNQDDTQFMIELQKLFARGVLTREPIDGGHGYACHPILRDHFRKVLLGEGRDAAKRAADLLSGPPSEAGPQSIKELEPVLLAIELLCDAGEYGAAHALYSNRLISGDSNIFVTLPALSEGLACAMGFIGDDRRRHTCAAQLSQHRLRFYLASAGLVASLSGRYDAAARFYSDASGLERELKDWSNLAITLQNRSELAIARGRLPEALADAQEAFTVATEYKNSTQIRNAYVRRGRACMFTGAVRSAAADFATANELQRASGGMLDGAADTWWAEFLLRAGHPAEAKIRATNNLEICTRNRWNHDIAACHWILGTCAFFESRLEDAERHLAEASAIFERGDYVFYLTQVQVTAASVALARRDSVRAHRLITEALSIAQPRGMRLSHADALVLRGWTRLFEANAASGKTRLDILDHALVPAEEALGIARDCGYIWAERDALSLQADAYDALAKGTASGSGYRARAAQLRADAAALSTRLRLTGSDLDDARTTATQRVAPAS